MTHMWGSSSDSSPSSTSGSQAPPQARAAGVILLLVALFLIQLPLFHATSVAPIAVTIYDADGHPVPDVLISASYQKNGSRAVLDGYTQGFTNLRGQWRTALVFNGNVTPAQYVQLSASTSFWSSDHIQARIGTGPNDELDINFTIPISFQTYRIQFISPTGPIPNAPLQLTQPVFLQRYTDSNGLVQMRFPAGLPVSGWMTYSGQSAPFSFSPSASISLPSQMFIRYPFENGTAAIAALQYNFSALASDSAGRPLVSQPFVVQSPDGVRTYWTDQMGMLRLFDVPYSAVNLSWSVRNLTYNLSVDFTHPPAQIQTPVLLQLQPPQVFGLGESCYRVIVNISDPRPDAIEQVVAQPENASSVLPFSLDSRRSVSHNGTEYNRVLCVVGDTGFIITASNQYENTSLLIQLRQSNDVPSPQSMSGNAAIGVAIPVASTSAADDAQRIEYIVILIELLVFLMGCYALVRFRDILIYYGQSILRSVHSIYQDMRTASFRRRRIGGPPPSSPPPSGGPPGSGGF